MKIQSKLVVTILLVIIGLALSTGITFYMSSVADDLKDLEVHSDIHAGEGLSGHGNDGQMVTEAYRPEDVPFIVPEILIPQVQELIRDPQRADGLSSEDEGNGGCFSGEVIAPEHLEMLLVQAGQARRIPENGFGSRGGGDRPPHTDCLGPAGKEEGQSALRRAGLRRENARGIGGEAPLLN